MLAILHTVVFSLFVGFGLRKFNKAFCAHLRHNVEKLLDFRSTVSAWFRPNDLFAAKFVDDFEDVQVDLLDRHQVETVYHPGTWQRQAYDDFIARLLDTNKTFPCIYGTRSFKMNELDFVFLDSEDLGSTKTARMGAKALIEYHKILGTRGRTMSLVILCPPPEVERTIDEYHASFWSFLRRLRQLDPKPWPAKIPRETNHAKWCMNFDGIDAFFVVMNPAHKQRLSRHAANFAMAYQPRYIFDNIFKDDRTRASATKMVRGLVDKYDQIEHSPDLADYGLPGTTESRQYCLFDENVTFECPYENLDTAAREE